MTQTTPPIKPKVRSRKYIPTEYISVEVGLRYKNRKGDVIKIIRKYPWWSYKRARNFCYLGSDGNLYAKDGRWTPRGAFPLDLIEELHHAPL